MSANGAPIGIAAGPEETLDPPDRSAAVLAVRMVSSGFHGVNVISDVTFDVGPGEVVGFLGANGAGKSTLFRTVAGLNPVAAGDIQLFGHSVERSRVKDRVAAGLVLVPQGYSLFPGLTVEENLEMGAWQVKRVPYLERLEEAFDLFPILQQRRDQPMEALSGGERAMLAIARGLMSHPKVLLLDEPSLGLSPRARGEVITAVQDLCARRGLSAVIAEQDMVMLGRAAARWHVLRNGRVVYSGRPGDLTPEDMRNVYLGLETDAV